MKQSIFGERYILVAENLPAKKVIDTIAAELKVTLPKKEISKIWVTLFAYWEILKSKLTNKKPQISLQMVDNLYEISIYNSDKIKSTLNYTFEPIDTVIKRVAKHYSSSERN